MTKQAKGARAILADEEVLRRRDKDSFDAGFQAGIDFGKEVNAELLGMVKGYRRWLDVSNGPDLLKESVDALIAKAEGA